MNVLHNSTFVLRPISSAIVRWKKSWDQDMQLQYPPTTIEELIPRRFNFCHDSIHFYWLARAFQPNRMHDWRIPSDTRLQQAMNWI